MATFTALEKAKIRTYLGYPDLFRYKNTRLESALDALSPEGETLVRENLTKLATIDDTTIAEAFANGRLKRVDEIEWHAATSTQLSDHDLALLQARLWAGRISTIFGVPFYADAFGDEGYPGDKLSE